MVGKENLRGKSFAFLLVPSVLSGIRRVREADEEEEGGRLRLRRKRDTKGVLLRPDSMSELSRRRKESEERGSS